MPTGLSVIGKDRNFKAITNGNHAFNFAPNMVDRNFTADCQNQKCPLVV
jgi:hypothetical protein